MRLSMNRNGRGFTLIEVLVVVSILGVLMGLVSILVLRSGSHQKKNQTEQLIKMHLKIAIERYNQEFKRLPPVNVAELTVSSSRWKALSNPQNNILNESAEVLLVALKHPDLSAPITESDWGFDNPTRNEDGDSWNMVPDGSDSADAKEIVDAYGNTIVYIHKNAYGKGPFRITNQNGEEVEVVACRKPDGQYYNPTSFQLISVGENGTQDVDDGVPTDASDDIMNFEPERE
jgi:prepilin-type N-terminal cleavage/methylation domain-containing protein